MLVILLLIVSSVDAVCHYKALRCGENEKVDDGENGCFPQYCSDLGFPLSCQLPLQIEKPPIQKCICIDGYVRDDYGICIPKEQCQSCGGDPNAVSGCGVNCGKTCADHYKTNVVCPLICYENACDCREGFVYDSNQGRCVQPRKCTFCSGPNEVLDTCPPADANSVFQNLYEPCKPTCRCIQGFYRLGNKCIAVIKPPGPEDSFILFQAADVSLTKKLLKQLLKIPGGSFVVSAYAILQILATLALFAKGATFDQLTSIIDLKNTDDIRNILDSIKGQTSVRNTDLTIELVSQIYADDKYPLSYAVLESQDSQNVNFRNPVEAADIINDWVEDKTDGFIDNIVSPSSFNAHTKLVLVNSLYFLAKWQNEFRTSDTRYRDFHPSLHTTINIRMMFQTAKFAYVERKQIDAQILKMPYKDTRASFLVYLPNKRDGLSNLITALNEDGLNYVNLDDLEQRTVSVSLPVFEIVTDMNLVGILTENNVTKLFKPSYDLGGLLRNPAELYVSSVIQRNRITINERGAEEASFAVATVARSAGHFKPVDAVFFTADHPFVFAIVLDEKIPLLAGVYNGHS